MKSIFQEKLKFNDIYSGIPVSPQQSPENEKIVFIMPLSGRYETFLRFLNNFEEVSKAIYFVQQENLAN